jgi:class 3 adenylate cyclase
MAESLDPSNPSPVPRPAHLPPQGEMTLRVADADRDRTVTLLREHVVDGRLTLDEFSERVGLALRARTRGDLDTAMSDLPAVAVPQEASTRRTARRHFIAVMSGATAKGRWRVGERTTAVAVMGGCEMDLRQAEIDGPEVVITAVAFWGGVKIVVPEGIDVQLEGFSFMGGRDLKLRDVPIVPGSPRIRVRAYAVMGGIEIRSRPNRRGRQIAQSVVENVLGTIATAPSLTGGAAEPIDLVALGRDIKQQIRNQRRSGSSTTGPGQGPAESVPATPAVAQPSDETVTILFSDMVNYAGITEQLGDAASRDLLREHHRIVRAALEQHGGREVKVQGDGFMVAFGSVARALRCAVDMQRSFSTYSEANPDRPIAIHIGVHTGEAIEEEDDFLGHTVIVASRLADVAGPGEILVSSLSEQLVARSGEFTFEEPRQATLKGMERTQLVATLSWAALPT